MPADRGSNHSAFASYWSSRSPAPANRGYGVPACRVDSGNGMRAADTQRGCQVPVGFPPRSDRVSDANRQSAGQSSCPSAAARGVSVEAGVGAGVVVRPGDGDIARRLTRRSTKGQLRASSEAIGAGTRWREMVTQVELHLVREIGRSGELGRPRSGDWTCISVHSARTSGFRLP